MYVGLSGTGNDVELDILKETEKAYLLLTEENEELWMPKSAFDDEGCLKESFEKMFCDKIENPERL